MQSSSEQPLVGEERYVTTLITASKETTARSVTTRDNKGPLTAAANQNRKRAQDENCSISLI